MTLALLPVIAIETFVVRGSVQLPLGRALGGVAAANAVSTLIGVPIAWLVALAIEFAALLPLSAGAERWHWQLDSPLAEVMLFVVGAAWMGPVDAKSSWMIPLAAAVLLLPCFFASVLIEHWICRRIWRRIEPSAVRQSVWRANIYSYAALIVFLCAWSVAWAFYSAHH